MGVSSSTLDFIHSGLRVPSKFIMSFLRIAVVLSLCAVAYCAATEAEAIEGDTLLKNAATMDVNESEGKEKGWGYGYGYGYPAYGYGHLGYAAHPGYAYGAYHPHAYGYHGYGYGHPGYYGYAPYGHHYPYWKPNTAADSTKPADSEPQQ